MTQKTTQGGTRTSQGWVPHYRHPCGLLFPVRVTWSGSGRLPDPVREYGRLVYTQPGGDPFMPESDSEIEQEMKTP